MTFKEHGEFMTEQLGLIAGMMKALREHLTDPGEQELADEIINHFVRVRAANIIAIVTLSDPNYGS